MTSAELIERAGDDIVKDRHFYDRFRTYLVEKKIEQKFWPLIIAHIIKTKSGETKNLIQDIIFESINEIASDADNFIILLETLAANGYDSNQIHYMIVNLDINLEEMIKIYKKMKSSEDKTVRLASGTVLGLLGRKSPDFLFEEISLNRSDDNHNVKVALLTGLFMASYKPYRNPNFVLPESIFQYVLENLSTSINDISFLAVTVSVRLFDLDSRFNQTLNTYVSESDVHKSNFLAAIQSENLVSNPESEISLLIRCSETESSKVISEVLAVYLVKFYDERIYKKKPLQEVALKLIKKWHKHPDFQHTPDSTALLENIAKVDTYYAFDFLLDWIVNQQDDPILHQFYYPKLIYNTFKSYEKDLIGFVERLISYDRRFDKLIDEIFQDIISDLRSGFDSKLRLHNETTPRDLKVYLSAHNIAGQLDLLDAEQLDDIPIRITKALEIVEEYELSSTDSNYKNLEHKKKELNDTLEFFKRKTLLLSECRNLLVVLAERRDLNHSKLTRNFKSRKIPAVMTSCEILRTEVFNENRFEIDCSIIKNRASFFPNIQKYLGYQWLEKKCQEGYPYHWILRWLSKMASQVDISQLLNDYDKENDPIQKEIRMQDLRPKMRSLSWLMHIDESLNFFGQGQERGKKEIISALQSDDNFFQFLSQLELANKLQQHGFNVSLEVPSINNRKIDIVAAKNGISLICELATLETYSELKYSRSSSNIPDKPKSLMLSKLVKQLSDYAKDRPGEPIFLIMNIGNAIDADLHGIQYALQGANIDNIIANRGKEIGRYTTFERDLEFLKIEEGKKLTGVICYRDEFNGLNNYLSGNIILNDSAEVKLEDKMILEVEEALFRKPMSGQPESQNLNRMNTASPSEN